MTRRATRRALLGTGAAVVTAGAAVAISQRASSPPGDPSDALPASLRPVYRWRLRASVQGWATSDDSGSASLDHDPAGWLLVRGTGHLAVQSPRAERPRRTNWTLSDRHNADRVTVSVRVDGPSEDYQLTTHLSWLDDNGNEQVANSAQLTVPTGVPIDVDTWWNCRGTAPSDVLQRVTGVGLTLETGNDDVRWRVRDIRQPPSVAPWGDAPSGVGRMFATSAPRGLPRVQIKDAYQKVELALLTGAHTWATTNHRLIHIGEWAWPKESRANDDPSVTASDQQYGQMAELWLRQADLYAIPYTPWGESGYWGGSTSADTVDYGTYPDASYFCGSSEATSSGVRAVSERKPSADILEAHHGVNPDIPPSINLVGMCFNYLQDGTQYSSTNIGTRGQDYFAEAPETLSYLHDRGYRVFRLPFRWDRVMRSPDDGRLDEDEWGYVESAIEAILELPDTAVIIDVHCGGLFLTSSNPGDLSVPATTNSIDGPTGLVTTSMFVNFWKLMSQRLRAHSDRLIYDIVNEPRDSNPYIVRRYTQAVVSALRAEGDRTFLLIPSYPYDNISSSFTEVNQPFPWIQDPLGTYHHAYTLHHYMDYDQSGQYVSSYDDTLAQFT